MKKGISSFDDHVVLLIMDSLIASEERSIHYYTAYIHFVFMLFFHVEFFFGMEIQVVNSLCLMFE
jgi:hypothetical protein